MKTTNNLHTAMKKNLKQFILLLAVIVCSGLTAYAQDQYLCEQTGVKRYSVTSQLRGSSFNWTVTTIAGTGTAPTPSAPMNDTVAAPNGSSAITIDWSAVAPGDYQIAVQETSADNCPGAIKTFVVRVVDKPVATITTAPFTVCYGDVTDVNVNITEGTPNYNLYWTTEYKDKSGTTISTVTDSAMNIAGPNHTINTTFPATHQYIGGTITVTLTNITDVNSVYCSNGTLATPYTVTITVNPTPNTSGITAE
jgi:hypothetical protein